MKITPTTFSSQNPVLRGFSRVLLALSLATLASNQVLAVTNDPWDPSGNTVDASGTWDTSTQDWDVAPYTWNNASGYTAVFGFGGSAPTGGSGPFTVTLGVPIVAGGITFNSGTTYTIAGSGANTLTLNSGSIITANAASSTVSAAIAGTGAVTVAGTGTLTLSGANTFAVAPPTSNGTATAALSIGSTSHVLLGSATTLQNEVISNADSTNGLIFQTGLGGTFTIGGLQTGTGGITLVDNATPTPNAITLVLGNEGAVATTGLTIGSAAGVDPTSTYGGVLSGAGNLTKGGAYVATTGIQADGNNSTTNAILGAGYTNPFSYAATIYRAGNQILTANNTYTGATTVSAGLLDLTTASGQLSGTSGLTVNGGSIFVDGDTTAANNNSVSNRIKSSATLTLGGTAGGGTFVLAQAATVAGADSQTLGTLTINRGGNWITAVNTGTNNTGALTFAGGAGGYVQQNDGIVNFGSLNNTAISGNTTSFTAAPTGTSVSGSGANAILTGATLNGNDFVKATSGALTAATYYNTTTGGTTAANYSGVNMQVAGNTAIASGAITPNSIVFNSSATSYTLTLATGATVASGDILVGFNAGAAQNILTGGTLTSGTGSLQIIDYGTADSNPRNSSAGLSIASQITGSINLDLGGGPNLTYLSNTANSFTGTIYLDGGALGIAGNGALGNAANGIAVENGFNELQVRSAVTANRAISINAGSTLQITGDSSEANVFTDSGALSGGGALGVGFVSDATVVALTGSNSGFTGNYDVNGVLRAQEGTGLSSNANIVLMGRNISAPFPGGVLEMSGTFTRSIGTGAGQIQWQSDNQYGSGGFAAYGGNLTVNLGGSGAAVTYGSQGFAGSGNDSQALILQDNLDNSTTNAFTTTFQNALVLGNLTNYNWLEVEGANSTTDEATISGVISGGSTTSPLFIYQSTGFLVLSNGNNSYTSPTELYSGGGTVSVSTLANGGSNSGIGASTSAAGNLIIASGATLQYTGGTTSTDRLFTIGAATFSSLAATTPSAVLDASGSGALTFSNPGSILFGGTAAPATLTLTGTNTGANTLDPILGNDGASATSLIKSGVGTWVLGGANTYSGGTTVSAGTLMLTGSGTLGATTGAVAVGTGTLNIGTTNQTVGAVTVTAPGTITGTTGTLTGSSYGISNTSGTATLSAILAGATSALTENGAGGTALLSGANTYGGGTTVTAGTLQVGNATALGASSGAVSVASGAVLDLDGTTMTNTNALTLNGTGISSGGALINSSATSGTYAGPITLGTPAGVSIVANSGALITTGAISTTSAGVDNYLILGGTGTAGNDLQSTFTDNGGFGLVISKIGSGTWTIGGNGTSGASASLRGGLAVSNGILNFGSATEAPSFTTSQLDAGSVDPGLSLSGTGVFNMVNGTLTLNATNGSSKAGIINTGTGNFTVSGGTLIVTDTTGLGLNNTSSGNINISGGSLSVTSTTTAGFENNGSGSVNITGGSLTVAGSGVGLYDIGSGGINVSGATTSVTLNAAQGLVLNSSQAYTQTAGAVTTNGLIEFANSGGISTVSVSGGSLTTTSGNANDATDLAVRGTTTFTLSGTGTFTTPVLNMTTSQVISTGTTTGTANSTFNLNGGTLITGTIKGGTNGVGTTNGTGAGTFNFNGGTLKSSASSTTFMTGITTANVRNGGALINTNGFNDTIGQALLHSSIGGDNAIDGGLTKLGSGTLTLTGADTYTGGTTVSGGTLVANNASALGSTSGTLAINGGGILDIDNISQTVGATTLGTTATSTGSTIQSTGGTATLTTSGVTVNGTGNMIASSVIVTGAISQSASSGLTVNGTGGTDALANLATLNGTGTLSTITLAGNNTVSSAGTLTTSGITVSGTGNLIGTGTVLGAITQNSSSALTVSGTAGSDALNTGATLAGSGSGSVTTVTLAGSNVLSGTLGTSGITVSGTGNSITGTVSGPVTFSGTSALKVTGTASGTVAVTSGATLSGTGTTGAVTMSSGGAINLQDSTIGTLHVGGLTTTGGTATFEIGVNTLGSIDSIADATNGTLSIGSGSTITIVNLGGGTTGQTLALGSYTLLTYGGTTSGASLSNFSLSSTTLDGDTLSLSTSTAGQLILNVAAAVTDTGSDYFNGTNGNLNVAASYDNGLSTGTVTTNNPSATSNLFFSATRNTTLTTGTVTSNLEVNSVNFGVGGTTSTFTVAGTNTLTIDATTANSNAAGSGITIATGGGSAIVNAPLALGNDQTWTPTDAASTLTINGQVSGAHKLTTAGAGTTVLANATGNTYSGGTEVSSGTLYANGGTATRTGAFVTSTSGSATGTGAVLIDSGAKLGGSGVIKSTSGGVTVASGGTLISGDIQAGTTAGFGLTLDNSANLSKILTVQDNATLSFSLGSGATIDSSDFAHPATQSTFLTVLGNTTGEIQFGTNDTINLVDLTGGHLKLTSSTPYLLIQAGGGDALSDNNLYAGLTTSGGVVGTAIQNGWVTNLNLTGLNGTTYPNERLYLYDGDLEVVPEPSTWALMIGGLALLVFVQRRRSKNE